MRALLPLGVLVALTLVGCTDSNAFTGPDGTPGPSLSCAGQSGNCGGGNHGNNSNNPPQTAP